MLYSRENNLKNLKSISCYSPVFPICFFMCHEMLQKDVSRTLPLSFIIIQFLSQKEQPTKQHNDITNNLSISSDINPIWQINCYCEFRCRNFFCRHGKHVEFLTMQSHDQNPGKAKQDRTSASKGAKKCHYLSKMQHA